jgi:hypothetical protein
MPRVHSRSPLAVVALELAGFVLAGLVLPRRADAQSCPPTTIVVDNDVAGSGYSEERAQNWETHNVGACRGTYRYLSRLIGDGSRRGRAIWQPTISTSGWYSVTVSYRATENRTNDADYFVDDDLGGSTHTVINQQHPGDCTTEDLGTFWCAAGGSCRVVLDGTDDSQSDAADATTFTLVSCGSAPVDAGVSPDAGNLGICAPIAAAPGSEVCEIGPARCAGVFTAGQGCTAFCASAGLVCAARFGGEPGCQQEPQNPIDCAASNNHQSDWCECVAPAPDAGQLADASVEDASQVADAASLADASLEDAGASTTEAPLARDGAVLTWCGAPIRLVGYGDYGLLAEAAFDYEAFFDRLVASRVNFVRVWGQYHFAADGMPFAGTRGAWDLERLDDAYFARMRAMVQAAARRGIIVQLTLFDSVALESRATGNRWINSPYRDENNLQGWLADPRDFDDVPPDEDPPVWRQVNQPYVHRVVDTLCDQPNVIYEVMNEPDGSGAEDGLGMPPFIDLVVGELHTRLARPECTGSRVISTNDAELRTLDDPRVDLVALHVSPERAAGFGDRVKPMLISNDGDDSQVSSLYGFGTSTNTERAARIDDYARGAFSDGAALGHTHVEILDKDLNGPTWLSQDYDPRAERATPELLGVLAGWSTTPPRACARAPEERDAGASERRPCPTGQGRRRALGRERRHGRGRRERRRRCARRRLDGRSVRLHERRAAPERRRRAVAPRRGARAPLEAPSLSAAPGPAAVALRAEHGRATPALRRGARHRVIGDPRDERSVHSCRDRRRRRVDRGDLRAPRHGLAHVLRARAPDGRRDGGPHPRHAAHTPVARRARRGRRRRRVRVRVAAPRARRVPVELRGLGLRRARSSPQRRRPTPLREALRSPRAPGVLQRLRGHHAAERRERRLPRVRRLSTDRRLREHRLQTRRVARRRLVAPRAAATDGADARTAPLHADAARAVARRPSQRHRTVASTRRATLARPMTAPTALR